MIEKQIISFNKTFLKYDQFEIKINETKFTPTDNPDNVYFCYNNFAYKIRVIGVRYRNGSTTEIKSIVFYSDYNIIFQQNNPNLILKEKIEIIITDENLSSIGCNIAD